MNSKKRTTDLNTIQTILGSLNRELIQSLTVIQAEIDLMEMKGTPPSSATLARLNAAVADILSQLRQLQTFNLQETEAFLSGSATLTLLAS